MKRLFRYVSVLIVVLAAVHSCTDFQEEEMPVSFGVDVDEIDFAVAPSTRSVTVSSGTKWDVTSLPSWVSLGAISRSGRSPYEWIANFSAVENDEFNREGKIIIKAGSDAAEISVTQEGRKGKCIAVESVSLSPTALTLTEGENASLTYSISPANASIKDVSWKSSAPSIATVSSSGRVEAVAEGTAKITVTTSDGNKTATSTVTVKAKVIPVTGVSLDRTSLSLTEGETYPLVATITPSNATNKSVTWSSSNSAVASVSSYGIVTAESAGSATITVTTNDSGKRAACEITVFQKGNISFTDEDLKIILVGHFDTNQDGELSYREAAAVSSIEGLFGDVPTYKSFDEFQFFIGVTMIPNNIFDSWSQLKSIVLPGSIVSIGSSAFNSCLSLQGISIPNSVKTIGSKAFSNCRQIQTIIIPKAITQLNSGTFSGCTALETISLPDNLTSIAWGTFSGCTNLKSIVLPSSLERIGISAFEGSGISSIIIPSSVTIVDTGAFENCSQLSSVSFSNPNTSIGDIAFKDCRKLTTVNLPSKIESLVYGLFWGCSSIKSIIIPDSVTKLGSCVFWGCSNLDSITIPKGVVSIGDQAFYRCQSLNSITSLAVIPPVLGSEVFYISLDYSGDYRYPDSIFVPQQSLENYRNAEGWKTYADRIQAIP